VTQEQGHRHGSISENSSIKANEPCTKQICTSIQDESIPRSPGIG